MSAIDIILKLSLVAGALLFVPVMGAAFIEMIAARGEKVYRRYAHAEPSQVWTDGPLLAPILIIRSDRVGTAKAADAGPTGKAA